MIPANKKQGATQRRPASHDPIGGIMHYTGTIWRPPYEWDSLLLEATAGCTHRACKFCTLYDELPFKFRGPDMGAIEFDLLEAQTLRTSPDAPIMARLLGQARPEGIRRVFLTGANPFALPAGKLLEIAGMIHRYLPSVETIGCFARITDSLRKTDGDLKRLREAGFTRLTIGVETGDDDALRFMRKGYTSRNILEQCRRLETAGIDYSFFYLVGIHGKGRGIAGAKTSAAVFNQLHPFLIGPNMLTVFPNSELAREIECGAWRECSEHEKYREIRALVEQLDVPTQIALMGASNAFFLEGDLPADKPRLLSELDDILQRCDENDLRRYRENLPSL